MAGAAAMPAGTWSSPWRSPIAPARLVAEGERVAVQLGLGTIYLLTMSASDFFSRQGSRVSPRL